MTWMLAIASFPANFAAPKKWLLQRGRLFLCKRGEEINSHAREVCPPRWFEAAGHGCANCTERADNRKADLAPTLKALQPASKSSLKDIATGMNEQSTPTARGASSPPFRARACWSACAHR